MDGFKTVSELKKGEFFILKVRSEPLARHVFVRGEYDRSTKSYICFKFDDVDDFHYFKGGRAVFTDFVF